MPEKEFHVRRINPKDYKRVSEFVIEYYYGDEPIFSCEPKITPGPNDLADIEACLKSGTSIMCYRETAEGEEIVGTALNNIKNESYVERYKEIATIEGNTKYGQYVRMLASMHENVNVCRKYNVNQFLYLFMISVDRKYRGKGIGFMMARASIDMAKQIGLEVFAADCSSYYSADLLRRMKFDLLYTLLFTDYVDENNRPYFVINMPHVATKTYASRLQ